MVTPELLLRLQVPRVCQVVRAAAAAAGAASEAYKQPQDEYTRTAWRLRGGTQQQQDESNKPARHVRSGSLPFVAINDSW